MTLRRQAVESRPDPSVAAMFVSYSGNFPFEEDRFKRASRQTNSSESARHELPVQEDTGILGANDAIRIANLIPRQVGSRRHHSRVRGRQLWLTGDSGQVRLMPSLLLPLTTIEPVARWFRHKPFRLNDLEGLVRRFDLGRGYRLNWLRFTFRCRFLGDDLSLGGNGSWARFTV